MRKLKVAAIGIGTVVLAAAPGLAEGGCGPDRYRSGLFGHCHWGRPPPPPVYYRPGSAYYGLGPGYGQGPAIFVDRFYPKRGYWDGQRYWEHRHHWHGGSRYD